MPRSLNPLLIATSLLLATAVQAEPPEGIYRSSLNKHQFDELLGVEPMGDGRILLWERGGKVLVSDSEGNVSPDPFLDIQEEVLDWRDHGLLGLTVDPRFLENGYVYLLYAVDAHHLHEYGTPQYDPNVTWTHRATIGRVTRYQATPESGYAQVDPASRTVLIGATIDTGLPIVHQSHACGTIMFGTDGSLLLSHGDSANYGGVDQGGDVPGGYVVEALKNGILKPEEDLGAFRAQFLDTMCGKVLRINPETGEGYPSNPFFVAEAPASPRSRVWSLGVRNPFRCSVLAGTGADDPTEGRPGTIAVNDVGWGLREETTTVSYPGANLGWPLWEGYDSVSGYWSQDTRNPNAENTSAGNGCPDTFMFRDLIQEERPEGARFSNPCNPSWYEAEEASTVNLEFVDDPPGHTGSGAMRFNGDDVERLSVLVGPEAGNPVDIRIRYRLTSEAPVSLDISIGLIGESFEFQPTDCPDCWYIRNIQIARTTPNSVLRIEGSGVDGLRIDRVEIEGMDGTGIPEDIPTFVHHRPDVDWYHLGPQYARVAGFQDGVPVGMLITDPESPVQGDSFMGNCAGGSIAINDPQWPEELHGVYLSDVYFQWLRLLRFDEFGKPTEVVEFDRLTGSTVDGAYDPATNNLYIVRWSTAPLVRYSMIPVPTCDGDFNEDGSIDGGDLGIFMSSWGTPAGDLSGDGLTDGADLGILLKRWGDCQP